MKITLHRINDAYHMQARNASGNTIDMDSSPALGGENKGMRPMETVLVALAGCSTIDVIALLEKQRQTLQDILVSVEAEREEHKVPALFTKIHLTYQLTGDLDPKKVERALSLSIDKYCSVAKMLEKTAVISYSYTIENNA